MNQLLTVGPIHTLVEDTVYATPARLCSFYVQTSNGTIEVSNDGTNWEAVVLDDNFEFVSSAPYIRSVDDDALVTLKGRAAIINEIVAPSADPALTYVTLIDETAKLPNSVQLVAGDNVTLDDSTPGELSINSSGGGSSTTVHQGSATLDNDQIKALPTDWETTVIIPTPGANRVLLLVRGIMQLDFIADYSNITPSRYMSLNIGSYRQTSNTIPTSDFFAWGGPDVVAAMITPSIFPVEGVAEDSYQSLSAFVNQPFTLTVNNTDGNFTGGDPANVLKIAVEFRVYDITLNRFLTTAESGWNGSAFV